MSWYTDQRIPLQGFTLQQSPFTIVIDYNFGSGVRSNGVRYSGTRRRAFLPGNEQGKEALGLLMLSFQRKFTFMVGTSLTTGKQNTVVWAGVHHKTMPNGGTSNFGYPDETYFARLKGELEDRGITPADIDGQVPLSGTLNSS